MTDKLNTPENERDHQRQTASSDDSSVVIQAVRSRRGVLAMLGLVGGGGVALSQYDGIAPWSDGDDDSASSDGELLMAHEIEFRSRLHSNRPSIVPSFEYASIAEQFDDPEVPVEWVAAEAIPSGTGDRIVFVLEAGQAQPLGEALLAFWTDTDNSRQYSTTLNDASVEFDVYTGGDISVGLSVRDVQGVSERTELLVARGYEEAVVEELLDTFDTFYDR